MSKPLILVAIIIPSCMLVIVSSVLAMASSRPTYHEWDVAEAYACAYRSGQIDTMNSLPIVFQKKQEMGDSLIKSCDRFKAIAAKHSFRQ